MSELPSAVLIPANADAAPALRRHGVRVYGPGGRSGPTGRHCEPLDGVRPLKETADPGAELFDHLAASHPGAVFIAGGDGVTLSLARHAGDAWPLRRASVPADAIYRLLNKRLLFEACRDYGVPTFDTLLLDGPQSTEHAGRTFSFPALLKPQTRVGRNHWFRARIVSAASDLPRLVSQFRSLVSFEPDMLAFDPLIAHPILQQYEPRSIGEVYHLCGYVAASGESAFRAHVKTLQYPRRFGNALCAEPAPVDATLRCAVLRLCRGVGYHGVIEVETIRSAGEYRVIDVNPRFYNGMALELATGLDLPWYAYLEAVGDTARLDDALSSAALTGDASAAGLVFCTRLFFKLMIASQLASGGMSPGEAGAWLRWYRSHREHMVDAVDHSDRALRMRYTASTIWSFARDPRYFAGTFLRRP